MADAGGNNDGGHSSGEYSGVIQKADVAYGGKGTDMSIVLSSGENARKDRLARREKKNEKREKEEKSGEKKK